MNKLDVYNKQKIIGEKTIMRSLQRSDLRLSLCWLKDPEINKFLTQNFENLTDEQESQWLEFIHSSNKDIVFAILTKKGKIYIGNCGLHEINWEDKTCEFGILIGNKLYWNKGYGSDAIKSAVLFAVNDLKLSKILLYVYEYNQRAIRVYNKCGFKIKKILKKEHEYNKKYWDTYLMEFSA
jgi:RimJ/RimL family protein N-acetyltransferase